MQSPVPPPVSASITPLGDLRGVEQREAGLPQLHALTGGHGRVGDAGADRVDLDPLGLQRRPQRAHQADHGVLGQRVDRVVGEAGQARDRRRGHDRAATPRPHVLDQGADAKDHMVDVDAHDPRVLLVGELGDVAFAGGDAGVEVGDVDAAELVLGLLDNRRPGSRVADVSLDVELGLAARRRVQVDHANLGALLNEALHGRLADTRRAARHQGRTPFKNPHHSPPPPVNIAGMLVDLRAGP